MRKSLRICGGGVAAIVMLAAPTGAVRAQSVETLPDVFISASRLGGGITGASTTVITAEDIARAPQTTLQDILSREAGVQTSSVFGGVNGAGTLVDVRGFGATAPSNTLILVDGRRMNDWDIPGFDLSVINKENIERIEITRGNSGAVLYGDGAVGGVINIVTKGAAGGPPRARIEGGVGSLGQWLGNASASTSSGPWSASASAAGISSDGYRQNNNLRQFNGSAEVRYKVADWSAFVNVSGDDQTLRTPGTRDIIPGVFNEFLTDPRGTRTPFDYTAKQGVRLTAGFTRNFAPGLELIVDGGVRHKQQQGATFDQVGSPFAYLDTGLTTASFTPRMSVNLPLFGMPSRGLGGFDLYETDYVSDRSALLSSAPNHRYALTQQMLAAYWQHTVSVLPTTDVSFGARIQRNRTTANDMFDPTAPTGPFGANPQGSPLDTVETNHALHLGVEHRVNDMVTLFGRLAQSFRVPNVDERVGASPLFVPTTFALRTQKSNDREVGVRTQLGPVDWQASVYDMDLTDELHFDPITFANINLDPTRRYGVETTATWRVTDTVRIKANGAYTHAVFRSGPFAGNDVPVVSRWTGSVALSWSILDRRLVFDAVARYVGRRFLDQDEANAGRMIIPAYALVDLRIGGEYDRYFWSFSVQNLFDKKYFDYGLDLTFGPFQYFSVYPLPGRTFLLRGGATFGG